MKSATTLGPLYPFFSQHCNANFVLSHHLIFPLQNIIYVLLEEKRNYCQVLILFLLLSSGMINLPFKASLPSSLLMRNMKCFSCSFFPFFLPFFFNGTTVHIHITRVKWMPGKEARYGCLLWLCLNWSPGSCHHVSLVPYLSKLRLHWVLVWFLSGLCRWKRGAESMGSKGKHKKSGRGQSLHPWLGALNLS